jgi:hypothetical protein
MRDKFCLPSNELPASLIIISQARHTGGDELILHPVAILIATLASIR